MLSTLFFALVYAARNYRANRHNAVLNSHRDTALRTFRSFVVATEDPQIKNAILQQAAQSIFTPQPSGYLTDEPEPTPHTTVVEILKSFGGKGTP